MLELQSLPEACQFFLHPSQFIEFSGHPSISINFFFTSLYHSSLCVHLTITPCQANDRSGNHMSAFLDSVALFSVPPRQITKKVKLASAITNCKTSP